MDIKEIQQKLYEKLEPSGWAEPLRFPLKCLEFEQTLEFLYNESKEGRKFTPPLKHVFRAFEECPFDKTRVVMLGQDPYPTLGVADGIAFSCKNNTTPQPSLRYIFKELYSSDTYIDEKNRENTDLTRWANQGVLMLNTAFTTQVTKVGVHYDTWKPFINYLMEILVKEKPDIVFVFMGAKAGAFSKKITQPRRVIKVHHPAAAVYRGGKWESQNLFSKINNYLYPNIIKW